MAAVSARQALAALEPMKVIYVTARRGLKGKCWRFKKIVTFLGLHKDHQPTVVVPNTQRVRSALEMVRHMVVLETPEMYWERQARYAESRRPHAPVTFSHMPLSADPVGITTTFAPSIPYHRLVVSQLRPDGGVQTHTPEFTTTNRSLIIGRFPTTQPLVKLPTHKGGRVLSWRDYRGNKLNQQPWQGLGGPKRIAQKWAHQHGPAWNTGVPHLIDEVPEWYQTNYGQGPWS